MVTIAYDSALKGLYLICFLTDEMLKGERMVQSVHCSRKKRLKTMVSVERLL